MNLVKYILGLVVLVFIPFSPMASCIETKSICFWVFAFISPMVLCLYASKKNPKSPYAFSTYYGGYLLFLAITGMIGINGALKAAAWEIVPFVIGFVCDRKGYSIKFFNWLSHEH